VTIIPLWITWLLFDFIFRQLSNFGMPVVRTVNVIISGGATTPEHIPFTAKQKSRSQA
jgi:uncharacterized membrane protein